MLAEFTSAHAGVGLVLAGALVGWIFAWRLRKQDLQTFLFARAPLLPVRSLSAHDDAWLRGTAQSDDPLSCPWFGAASVAYGYSIEEKRTERYRDSDGRTRTRTRWVTVHSRAESIDFTLKDDGDCIDVALTSGECEAQRGLGTDYEHSRRRHCAWTLPVGATVSAFGVKRDDGSFGPLRNVPLLVTFETRNQRVRRSAAAEGWLFFAAQLFLFAGVVSGAGVLWEAARWQQWLLPVGLGLAAIAPQWALLTYNRLVRLRQQVRTAEKQISIELAQRAQLVPNLIAVVKAASRHEQELLTHLTAARSGGSLDDQVRGEEGARGAARAVLALHERYPDLKADALYCDLHARLWTIEEKVAHARGFYNDTVTEWNDRVQKVPSRLIAAAAGMRSKRLFETGDEVELPPRLDLS